MSTKPDLSKFMTKVQGGRLYLTVAGRLVWFRAEHPDWGIVTEALEINHEKQFAIFRATIYTPTGQIMATATKKEDAKGFGDYIEKSETGSIGRALNLCGFGTDDLDEAAPQRPQQPTQPRQQERQPAPQQPQASDPKPLSPEQAAAYRQKTANVMGRWDKGVQEEWGQYIRETYDAEGGIKDVEDQHIYALWREVVAAQREASGVASPETKPQEAAPANP